MELVASVLRWASGFATTTTGMPSRLPILFYHRVLERPDPLVPDAPDIRRFDIHMSTLARFCRVVSLDEGIARLLDGRLRSRSVCITFDDGYRDNYLHALPVLRRHRLTSSFFIATGFLDGGRMFCDTVIEAVRRFPPGEIDLEWFGLGRRMVGDVASRIRLIDELTGRIKYLDLEQRNDACDRLAALAASPLPDDLMMRSEHVREMHHAGMTIGGHTVDHPILCSIPNAEARRQVVANREALANITEAMPRFFAYPNGKPGTDYGLEHVRMVREAGYSSALTTVWGSAVPSSDPFQLPRIAPWQHSPVRFAAGLVRAVCSRRAAGVVNL